VTAVSPPEQRGKRRRDPLLVIARFSLGLMNAIFLVGAVVVAGTLPVVFMLRDKVLEHIAANGGPPEAFQGLVFVQVLAVIAALQGFFFFRNLYRIIETVGEGDPFVPENASRLNAMGWIAVAAHILAIPLNLTSQWLETISDRFRTDFGISFAVILLAVVLFILARVFREGTRMRDELEGTV